MIYCINGGFRESSILIPNKGNREQCEELVHLSFILETFFFFFHTTVLYYYILKDIYVMYVYYVPMDADDITIIPIGRAR